MWRAAGRAVRWAWGWASWAVRGAFAFAMRFLWLRWGAWAWLLYDMWADPTIWALQWLLTLISAEIVAQHVDLHILSTGLSNVNRNLHHLYDEVNARLMMGARYAKAKRRGFHPEDE